jgi:hypothetical protein
MNVTSKLSRKLRKELGFGISGAHSRTQRRYMSESVKNNDTNHMVRTGNLGFGEFYVKISSSLSG